MYKEEINKIENLITDYFHGIYIGDVNLLGNCFHDNVYIYGDIKNVDYLKSIKEYLDGVKSRKSPRDLGETMEMKIIGIDIIGKIAMVKLHVPMLGYNYYDYLSLSKIAGDWKIVNKIFTHVE